MSEIVISYARSTATQAHAVAEALRALGYDVWRDDQLPAHRSYSEVIAERLETAKAVVVVWSAEAVKSDWVQSEADRAREAGKLVQLNLDDVRLPMPFDRIQCADLTLWTGDTDAPGWRKVVDSVAALIGGGPAPIPSSAGPGPTHAGKPSVAVLPFTDMTGAQVEDYFADGMVDEIATALSRFPSLFVSSGGSNVSAQETKRDLKQIARELGVRYVLQGSIRKAGKQVRIAVKLVEPALGEQLWAERFDGALEDVFVLQDKVASAVASQIEPNIEAAEIRRARNRPTQDLGAYDLWLRALHKLRIYEKAACLEAIALLDQALARDPEYGLALGLASYARALCFVMAWRDDRDAVRREGLEQVDLALRYGADDPQVLAWVAAAIANLGGDLATAEAIIERALERNPGSSFGWYVSGYLNMYGGRFRTALEHLTTSLRLDPRSPDGAMALSGMAWTLFGLRRFEEALALQRDASQLRPGFEGPVICIGACYAHLGRIAEAKAMLQEVPAATIAGVLGVVRDADFAQSLRSALALAGGGV